MGALTAHQTATPGRGVSNNYQYATPGPAAVPKLSCAPASPLPSGPPSAYHRAANLKPMPCSGSLSLAASSRLPSRLRSRLCPSVPAHAPAPGACAALAQRKARIGLREAAVAEGAEPVADLRLQAPRRHKLALRRKAARILERPQPVHAVRRRPQSGSEAEREPAALGTDLGAGCRFSSSRERGFPGAAARGRRTPLRTVHPTRGVCLGLVAVLGQGGR